MPRRRPIQSTDIQEDSDASASRSLAVVEKLIGEIRHKAAAARHRSIEGLTQIISGLQTIRFGEVFKWKDPTGELMWEAVRELLGDLRSEARACKGKIGAGAVSGQIGAGSRGGGSALDAVDRLEEIRDGLSRISRGLLVGVTE